MSQQQRSLPQAPWSSFAAASKRPKQPRQPALSVRPVNVAAQSIAQTTKKKSLFELAYKETLAQLELLEQKLRQQSLVSLQLERNTLEYYYTNTICLEGHDGEEVLQQNGGWHHYYFTSAVSKARHERRERRAREEQQLQEERRKVQLLEQDVRDHIINGTLAEERDAVKRSEDENVELQQQLTQKLAEAAVCSKSLQDYEERQRVMQQERAESMRRIQRLKEEKQKQMENVDATRLVLSKEREELEAAQAELKRREKVVSDLRETIARLSRKRRQRE
ncbi:hypothetical protein TraAM80_02377 [Trypanosoma rangeli]|uniref:Uncharacterized protein n=1 Tax=Trypanosoma rangeli TaxID=5698 RepID=A0A3R7KLQ6_TRYRA|nr:uncharacterized protein TraAM80_02377 [Trypanosoma rangeli]RNF08969.1 hypothetical protein TraAM80_02377 [Trypanosoma rangeli]|eukprot:RNF08969.1 hypothetical protein TraAM80_02377 [Trypanosoma rangeli]